MSNEIVKNQHIFPNRSIERFCGTSGMVQVYRLNERKTFHANPKNKMFCADRVWDQRSEQGYGKKIEDRYQSLAEQILMSRFKAIPAHGHKILSEFYSLWYFRSNIRKYDGLLQDNPKGIFANILTNKQKQDIELKHGIYAETDGTIPIHFKRGQVMEMAIDGNVARNNWLKWYISESRDLEFIVSDNPTESVIIPCTPKLCFICEIDKPFLSLYDVKNLNIQAILRSKKYYFARKLSACLYRCTQAAKDESTPLSFSQHEKGNS